MNYRADLDGIRCVAVSMVLAFHFHLFPRCEGGFVGVDVFFVLSGFLISGLIWKDLEAGRFNLRDFYVRRLRRLGPALLVVQLGALLFSAFALLPRATLALAWQSLYTQLYVVNFHFWKNLDYFGLRSEEQPLLHAWSLAVEEQFYMLFPLLALLVHRFARPRWPLVLSLIGLGSFGLNLWLVQSKPEATFYLLPTRAWEFLAGALLLPYLARWFGGRGARNWAGALGVLLLLSSLLFYQRSLAFPGWFALFPVLGTMGLILAGTGGGSFVSQALAAPGLVYIGKISYSLYLVHWPLRVFTASLLPEYSFGYRLLSLALSFALAALIYHWVEDPVRKGRFFAEGRRFALTYAALLGLVVACVVWSIRSHGWRGRFTPEVLELAAFADDANEGQRSCEHPNTGRAKPECIIGSRGARPTFTVLGDSHAMALADAFGVAFEERGESGVLVAHHGCMPVLGFGGRRCEVFMREALAGAAAPEAPLNVVLVSIWRPEFDTGILGPGEKLLAGPEAERAFREQFQSTLATLHQAGKHAYVWMGLPDSPRSVPEALAMKAAFGIDLPITIAHARYQQDFAFLERAVRENAALVTGTLSAAGSLCRDGVCRFVDQGRPLFYDNNHPARSSAPFFARSIARDLGHTPSR